MTSGPAYVKYPRLGPFRSSKRELGRFSGALLQFILEEEIVQVER